MVEIAEYEKRGDLSAPFELTKGVEREQRDAEDLQKHVQTLVDGFPPLPADVREEIGRILSAGPSSERLKTWRLRLYCGHVVERAAHHTNTTLHAAFTGGLSCSECGLDPAVIVDGEVVGLLQQPARAQGREPLTGEATRARKPTKAELEARVHELEAEISRLRGD